MLIIMWIMKKRYLHSMRNDENKNKGVNRLGVYFKKSVIIISFQEKAEVPLCLIKNREITEVSKLKAFLNSSAYSKCLL